MTTQINLNRVDLDRVDMRAANQIGNQINGYLISHDPRDLDPIRDLIDKIMAAKCPDTVVATFGRVAGSQLTEEEAAYALDMSVEDVRTMRGINTALASNTPEARRIRAEMRAHLAQAA